MGIALSAFNSPAGVRLPSGTVITPGTEIFYVHATPSYFAAEVAAYIDTTIELAMAKRNPNVPGAIIVLPGHTQNITAATPWAKARTQIIFLGEGDERGTLTWTASASSVTISAANIRVINGRFQLEPTTGTVTVAAPFVVSAAGCAITDSWFGAGTDANNKVTIGITTTAGATRFAFQRNTVRGAAAATMTTFLRIVGVTDFLCTDNDIICGTTVAAVGPVQLLTTLSSVSILRNYIQNNAASSTACITGMANATGWVALNSLRNMTDASNAHIALTSAIWQEYENYGVNNTGERGIILGTASV